MNEQKRYSFETIISFLIPYSTIVNTINGH